MDPKASNSMNLILTTARSMVYPIVKRVHLGNKLTKTRTISKIVFVEN